MPPKSIEFRTITAIVEVECETSLSYPGVALTRARQGLEAQGFVVKRIRNEHSETDELPNWLGSVVYKYSGIVGALSDLIQAHAPSIAAHNMISRMIRTAQADGRTDEELSLMLAQVLVDGWRHGNWPWNTNTEDKDAVG